MKLSLQEIFDQMIPAASAVVVIALVVFANWFDRRRAAARAKEPNPQDRLLRESIDNVIRDLADRITVVRTDVSRSPRGFTGDQEDRLLIVFLVDSETERSPAFQDAAADVEAQIRRQLLLSGYFRYSSEVVSVLVISRWRYENTDWYR